MIGLQRTFLFLLIFPQKVWAKNKPEILRIKKKKCVLKN